MLDFRSDEVAEWLRRWTANPMCSARVGSNPILVEKSLFTKGTEPEPNNSVVIYFSRLFKSILLISKRFQDLEII